jgi:hypothetical protein
MKITKAQLKRIILEELKAVTESDQPDDQDPTAERPTASKMDTSKIDRTGAKAGEEMRDVQLATKYLKKIDNHKEFGQLLAAVLKHAEQDPQMQAVLQRMFKSRSQLGV